ncbi:unnamed protein product [Peniophora sp. CBMAI 1063]|nr:unnamed protein product [Peniophora sp. CBMAI 1063]
MPQIFRVHVQGTDDDLQSALPPYGRVVEDIKRLKVILKLGSLFGDLESEPLGWMGTSDELRDQTESVRYMAFLPELFLWSYLVRPVDVPSESVESAIFALKHYIKILENETDATLVLLGFPDESVPAEAQHRTAIMLMNARRKLSEHLMRPGINRPTEASPHMRAYLEYHQDMYKTFNETMDHWMRYPNDWVDCGEVMCLSGDFSDARETLERGLAGCEARPKQPGVDIYLLRSHIHLSLILDRLDVNHAAQKEHTDWAVKQLRRSPTRVLRKEELSQYLLPTVGGKMHPVLQSLGGKSWLKKVNAHVNSGLQSWKEEERSTRSCLHCGVRDVQKALSRCARCQSCYYCSKDCQKADWEAHKKSCQERHERLKELEARKKEDPVIGQQLTDLSEWMDAPAQHRRDAHISALGVHRDPSRGRTHILMEGMAYTPDASDDPRYKFTVTTAGVFRISDVLQSIELSLGLTAGEGQSYIQSRIDKALESRAPDLQRGDHLIVIPILSMCSGIKPGQLHFQMASSLALRELPIPYNPEWRKAINGKLGVVAGDMILRYQPGVKDVETVFE